MKRKQARKQTSRSKRKAASSLTKLTASGKGRFALTTARLQSQYELKLHDKIFASRQVEM